MSDATDRLARATIEVCARLAMAEEQGHRDADEIARLRRAFQDMQKRNAEEDASLIQEIEDREKHHIPGPRPGFLYQRVDRICDHLVNQANKERAERLDLEFQIRRMVEHYEAAIGFEPAPERGWAARLESLFNELQARAKADMDPIPEPVAKPSCTEPCKIPPGRKFCTVCGNEDVPF